MIQPWKELGTDKTETKINQINFAYSFRPLCYFSRIFGLVPFKIIINVDGSVEKPRVSVGDGLWFVISICFYILLAIISYQNTIFPESLNISYLMIIGDYVLLILGLGFGLLMIIMDMCNRFKIINILQMFNNFDQKVTFSNSWSITINLLSS